MKTKRNNGMVTLSGLEASLKRAVQQKQELIEALESVLMVADAVDSYRRIQGKPHPDGFCHMAITECSDKLGGRPGGSYAHFDFEPLRKLLKNVRES